MKTLAPKAALLALLTPLASACEEVGEPLRDLSVGVAVVDLSPDEEELQDEAFFMGGYGLPFARRPTGVHDPIMARAMALESRGEPIILVSVDGPGFSNRARAAVTAKVREAIDIDEERVLVGSTHSHAGPDFQGVWGGVPPDYRARIIDAIADAAVEAFEGRVEAKLHASEGVAENRNRRGWDFTDDAYTILDAVSLDGERIGTLVNFAAHPVVLGDDNTLLSRDFVGYTVDAMEAELGAPVLYFNGIQGDVSPVCPEGEYADDFEKAQACGEAYATTMLAGMDAREELARAPLAMKRASWEQRVDNRLFQLAFDFADYDVKVEGSEEDPRYALELGAAVFTLGDDLGAIAFPGEPLSRLGMPLKEALPGRFQLFLGLTTDSTGYFIPGDEWRTGRNDDYEESVSLAEDAGDNAAAEVEGLLEK